MRFSDPKAPESAQRGYWDADNLIRLFLGPEGQGISDKPPSAYLFVNLRDMTARGVGDAQEYLDGFNQRFEDLAGEVRGEWQTMARHVAGLWADPRD